MVKLKKTSKRMSCSRKYKIEKKVREHQRKVRKNGGGADGGGRKLKKDPGIPNLLPYKEKVLQEISKARLDMDHFVRQSKRVNFNEADPFDLSSSMNAPDKSKYVLGHSESVAEENLFKGMSE